MAENATKVEIRKFRKKLREIEHLERLERELTEDEEGKIGKKSSIRVALKKLLKQRELSEEKQDLSEIMEDKCKVEEGNSSTLVERDSNIGQLVPAGLTTEQSNIVIENVSASKPQKRGNPIKNSIAVNIGVSDEKTASVSEVPRSENQASVVLPTDGGSQNASPLGMTRNAKQTGTASKNAQWLNNKYIVRSLQGHNDIIFSVDMDQSVLVSASRDTMIKVWDCNSGNELRSLGGHTGGVTSVVLVKKDDNVDGNSQQNNYLSVSASHDCSIRIWSLSDGSMLRSIYAYSPILCLDHDKGRLVSGSESGKVELWDLDAGENIRSVRSGDDSISCVQFKDDRIISGSSSGVVKIWDVRQRSLAEAVSSDTINTPLAKPRRIHCLAPTDNEVYYGDDGSNIKVLDIRASKVRKLKNHLTEFGSTSAMVIQDSLLISSGYDLDKGTGYLNVRSLPSEDYLATLEDDVTGYISCLCAGNITKDGTVCQRLCTGGNELKIWDQLPTNKIRKRPRGEESTAVACKHLRRYGSNDNIDTESSGDSDDEHRDESSEDDDDTDGTPSTARQSWCSIS